jgi:hypothetical protein
MVGNFLNGSNFQGGAFGIRISSINKLVDTRASSNDTTLLHFLCTMIEEKFPDISKHLLDDLELCGDACRGKHFFFLSFTCIFITVFFIKKSDDSGSYQGLQRTSSGFANVDTRT